MDSKDFSNRTPIYVVGYPRSGNTWLSRLLGEILDSPVGGIKNALPLATEGLDRPGKFAIYQLHLKPDFKIDSDEFIVSANTMAIRAWKNERVVYIMRDPRDIAVSVYQYWDMGGISKALNAMANGTHPLKGVGSWIDFVSLWEDAFSVIPVGFVYYESLRESTHNTIKSLLDDLAIMGVTHANIERSIKAQDITEKKKQISKEEDNNRPYGKTIQLKHLRKGEVGDWINHFTAPDALLANDLFGNVMNHYGYITSDMWWREL